MKTKNLIAIAVFFATFTLSAALFGTKQSEMSTFRIAVEKREISSPGQTALQGDIRRFLETDWRNGLMLSVDADRANRGSDRSNEEFAVSNLLIKMRAMDCANLPAGFRAVWFRHLEAWENYGSFLKLANESKKRQSIGGESSAEYLKLNDRINSTYDELLSAAKDQGVDFEY